MKSMLISVVALTLFCAFYTPVFTARAQGTAFTYQGRLNSGTNPANGMYDFVFAIYGSPTGTIDGFANQTNSAAPVSNGLFTVALDLGQPGIFTGPDRWLEIAVRTNGNGAYATLVPRQKLTPTPYAITAGNVVSNGLAAGTYGSAVTFNNTGNSFSGNGSGLANVNALALGGIGSAGFWQTAGNAGTTAGPNYLGTADNQPLELQVNGQRALRLEPNAQSPNVVVGHSANVVTNGFVGALIAGGGSGSYPNRVGNNYASVLGGIGNTANGYSSTAMGNGATASADYSTAIGVATMASGYRSTAIGNQTTASGSYAMAAGNRAMAIHSGTFVWADSTAADFLSTAANQFLIRAGGGVGINNNNPNGAALAVNGNVNVNGAFIGTVDNLPVELKVNGQRALRLEFGFDSNSLSDAPNVIGGYIGNVVTNGFCGAVIAGGGNVTYPNHVGANYATVLGGGGNTASGVFSTASGIGSTASGLQSTAMGNYATASGPNSIALGSVTLASGTVSIAIGTQTVAGGAFSTAMGRDTAANGIFSTAMGRQAKANHTGAFVWGDSTAADFASTAADQFLIRAGGGVGINTTNPMGTAMSVTGDARLDAQPLNYNEGLALNFPTNMSGSGGYGGLHFHSTAQGGAFDANSIKWGMFYNYTPENGIAGNGLSFAQNNANTRLYISTNGNVGIGTLNPTNKLMVVNARCDGSSWINASDRNLKQGFAGVDAQAVLARVAALPVTTWSYKAQPEQKHLGPVAQDFHAAFGLGQDDTSISTVDESGVALSAIQGLNQKVEDRGQKSEFRIQKLETETKAKEAEIQELKQRLAFLERIILNQKSN